MAPRSFLSSPSGLRGSPPLVLAFALISLTTAADCERPPSADSLKEWTPADHDRAEEQSNQASGQQGPPVRGDAGANTLIEATWGAACSPCHGPAGRGDGPNGPMVNAPDLTRDDLQSKFTDDDLAAIIKNGKNRMPKFDLSEPVVRGLIARIRSARGR